MHIFTSYLQDHAITISNSMDNFSYEKLAPCRFLRPLMRVTRPVQKNAWQH
jgi:hypothetical protein